MPTTPRQFAGDERVGTHFGWVARHRWVVVHEPFLIACYAPFTSQDFHRTSKITPPTARVSKWQALTVPWYAGM